MKNPKKGTRNAKWTEKEKKGTEERRTRNEEAKEGSKAETSNTTTTHRGEEESTERAVNKAGRTKPKGTMRGRNTGRRKRYTKGRIPKRMKEPAKTPRRNT